jgi:hypothetical protein
VGCCLSIFESLLFDYCRVAREGWMNFPSSVPLVDKQAACQNETTAKLSGFLTFRALARAHPMALPLYGQAVALPKVCSVDKDKSGARERERKPW